MKTLNSILLVFFIIVSNFKITAQSNSIKQAEIFIKQGNYSRAISILDEHINLNPYDDRAYIMRAWSHGILGHRNEKQQDLDFAEHLNPLVYMYINESIRSSLYEKKLFDYDFSFMIEDFTKSPVGIENYKKYVINEPYPKKIDSITFLAIQYLSNFKLSEAEPLINKIGQETDSSNLYYDLKGILELKKNQIESAIDYFTNAINKSPNYAMAYHNRSIAHMSNSDFVKAEIDLSKAISLDDNIAIFYFTKAKFMESVSNEEEAIKLYKKATSIDPKYIEAKTNLMLLQKSQGNYNESITELSNLINTYNKDAEYHYIKGGLDLTYGLYNEAILEFETFLLSNPEDPSAIFNLGLSKYLNNQKIEGCEEIKESIEVSNSEKKNKIYSTICKNITFD